jgi:hypothetical protein
MAEPRTRFFHTKQLERRNLQPMVVVRSGMGDRKWGFIDPRVNDPIGSVLNSGEVMFEQTEITDVPTIEEAARLISLSPLQESNQPLDQDILGSWGQGQRSILQCEAHNDDGKMTNMVGQEYLLNQPVYLFVGFPGLPWDYSQQRYKGTINRITLTKNGVRIEAETLC